MADPTMQVSIFNCANLAAAGIMLRGKLVQDGWQVHRVGCRDLTDLVRAARRQPEHTGTLAEVRDDFNANYGEAAGFEPGWDFDQHVDIKPCVRK